MLTTAYYKAFAIYTAPNGPVQSLHLLLDTIHLTREILLVIDLYLSQSASLNIADMLIDDRSIQSTVTLQVFATVAAVDIVLVNYNTKPHTSISIVAI